MNITDETLMAYADGELDAAARAQLAAAIAADATLAQRVAAHRALRARLRAQFDPVLEEPLPARLVAGARDTGTADARMPPLQRPVRPAWRPEWRQWGALAAGLALGAVAWQFIAQPRPLAIALRSGDLHSGEFIAGGALARALDSQLASAQDPAAAIQIGISFRARDGSYCRTFQLRAAGSAAGLACRGDDAWKLQVLSRAQSHMEQYRQAASTLPPAVLQAVDASIAGEPLDAAAEARARAANWRGTATRAR